MADEEEKGADIRTHVRGDKSGWWVIARSPRGEKKLGPYSGSQAAMRALASVDATLRVQGRYGGPLPAE